MVKMRAARPRQVVLWVAVQCQFTEGTNADDDSVYGLCSHIPMLGHVENIVVKFIYVIEIDDLDRGRPCRKVLAFYSFIQIFRGVIGAVSAEIRNALVCIGAVTLIRYERHMHVLEGAVRHGPPMRMTLI